VFLTVDRQLWYQNLASSKVAVIVLVVPANALLNFGR